MQSAPESRPAVCVPRSPSSVWCGSVCLPGAYRIQFLCSNFINSYRYRINSTTLSLGIFHRFPTINPSICFSCNSFSIVFFPTFKMAQHSRKVIISGTCSYIKHSSFHFKIRFALAQNRPYRFISPPQTLLFCLCNISLVSNQIKLYGGQLHERKPNLQRMRARTEPGRRTAV